MNSDLRVEEIFGVVNPVKRSPSRKSWLYRCLYNKCLFFGNNLARHLTECHLWEKSESKLESSCRLKLYRHLKSKSRHCKTPKVRKYVFLMSFFHSELGTFFF